MDPGIISTPHMRDRGAHLQGEALDLGVWNISVTHLPSFCAAGGTFHVLSGFLSFHLKNESGITLFLPSLTTPGLL